MCRQLSQPGSLDVGPMTYLAHKLFVSTWILIWAQSLLEECKQDRDYDACLQTLSEADEVYCIDRRFQLPEIYIAPLCAR